MESHKEWYEMAKDLFPKKLTKYVDFVLSPVIEDFYSFFRGSRYKSIPKRSYDFVFVDGPSTTSSSDKTHLFNYDFFHIFIMNKRFSYIIIKNFYFTKIFIIYGQGWAASIRGAHFFQQAF